MCRVPQNIRNYFTNYTQRLTPSPVPMNSRQLGDALRNARNQSVGSQEISREKGDARRVQDHGIAEANSQNETKTVQKYKPSRNHNESTEKKSGCMKELSTAKIESVPFTWL